MGIAKANKNTLCSIGERVCSIIVFYFFDEINMLNPLTSRFGHLCTHLSFSGEYYARYLFFLYKCQGAQNNIMNAEGVAWLSEHAFVVHNFRKASVPITYLLRSHVNQKTNDSSQYYEYQQNCYHHHNS